MIYQLLASNGILDAGFNATLENSHTPNYDMDDKLKGLLQKLYDKGHRVEVLRCIDKLRKTLPGMIEFYKQLVADAPRS